MGGIVLSASFDSLCHLHQLPACPAHRRFRHRIEDVTLLCPAPSPITREHPETDLRDPEPRRRPQVRPRALDFGAVPDARLSSGVGVHVPDQACNNTCS